MTNDRYHPASRSDQAKRDLGNSLSKPDFYARPLIPVLLALMCGIIAGLYLPGLSGVLLAICAVLLLCLFLAFKSRKARLLPLVLFFLLGYWSLQGWVAPNLPANHVSHFIDDGRWHIIGTLDGHPQRLPDRTRFTLRVESLTRNQRCYRVTGSIRVTVRAHADRLAPRHAKRCCRQNPRPKGRGQGELYKNAHLPYRAAKHCCQAEPPPGRARRLHNIRSGDRVGCLARLKEIRSFSNPGGFDYRRYMTFRGIWAAASVSDENLLIRLHAAKTNWFRHALEGLREAVCDLIERASPQEVRGLLKALLIADRSEILPEIREVFNRTGIAHLLAISGLHIGMVATVAFFGFRILLARSQKILLAGWVTRAAAVMSALPVLFYGFLAGMSPATQRAVIMVMVFLLALLFERERDTINTLAVAALVILIINPSALLEISFQLSVV